MSRTKSNTQPKQKPGKSMEAALWESANKLRGAVEPAEYKHVVLSLIFSSMPATASNSAKRS